MNSLYQKHSWKPESLRILSMGYSVTEICKSLGISRSTFYYQVKVDDEFRGQVEYAKATGQEELLKSLISLAEKAKDWRAYAWLLEKQYPRSYGKVCRKCLRRSNGKLGSEFERELKSEISQIWSLRSE